MSLGKFLNPRNDFAFKHIFGSEKNKDILIHFLNDMLEFTGDKTIEQVSYLKTNQDPEIAAQKFSLLDVLCQDQKGRQYIVEMQVAKRAGFEKRAQYYAAKTYSRQLDGGENYHDLKEVIFLAITDFVMFPDKKEYKCNHIILDKKTLAHDLKDFSFTFLELPKFTKEIQDLKNMTDKWAYFFKHAEETTQAELTQIVGSDKVIERAYEALDRFSLNEIDLNTYEHEEKRDRDTEAVLLNARWEGIAEGKAEGKAEGIAEGIAKERLAMAKKMLLADIEEAVILQCSGLSKEELEKLKNKNN
jgi:predicted transposase/invertase (TIGR01784 family)